MRDWVVTLNITTGDHIDSELLEDMITKQISILGATISSSSFITQRSFDESLIPE